MESKNWLARALALALLVPVAACSNEDNDEATIDVETDEAPATTAAPMTVMINPQGGSTIGGDLTATHEADNTKMRLSLTGLTEGKTYNAVIRYGDCTVASNYLDGDDDADARATDTNAPATPETAPADPMTDEHEVGEQVVDFTLDETEAGTATGEVDIDNDDLRADEAAFAMVTEDAGVGEPDVLVGCADLRGHGAMGGMGTTPAPAAPATPGAEPGAAAPADPARR